ncbi:uncharacterized protein PV07_01496 [Cladophialophora immunda]|uniref:MalT-like TPR region domain-containing protein n=1 Tax=Cladophialophora immunda TaxID=569365 RepID=A0A0D2CUB0_9EURO|nr:uncharacterized protein PV07_01496 [Cladophialophora immunda]KIW34738.1 hypothetical protein PV07_01496 [Cladophialophora immunda]
MYASDGQYSRAEAQIASVCQGWEHEFRPDSLHYAWGLTLWASALQGLQELPTALAKMQVAKAMYTERLGQFHLDTLHANRQLAGIYESMGQLTEAEELLQHTKYGHELTITEDECPPDYLSTLLDLSGAMPYAQNLYSVESSQYLECLRAQNDIKRYQGDWQQVENISRDALRLSLSLYGSGHWQTLTFRAVLAESMCELGLWAEAETTALEALEESHGVEGSSRGWRLKCLSVLGSAYELQGRNDIGVDTFLQALELSREIYGNDHRHTQIAEIWLAQSIKDLTDRRDVDVGALEPVYRKVRDTWMRAYGSEDPRTIEARARYAHLLSESWKENEEEEEEEEEEEGNSRMQS